MTRISVGLVMATSLLASTPHQSQPPRPSVESRETSRGPFTVAVLRRDGGLIPVGVFNGRRWEVTWPWKAITEVEIPLSLASVPRGWWGRPGRRDEWQVWSNASGRPIATVHLTTPSVVATQCTGRLALMTDYRDAEPPPRGVQPYPKVGLAVSPPISVERIEVLAAPSSEREAIEPALKEAFDRSEDALAVQWVRAGDPHPVPPKERHEAPLGIEAMYAGDDGGGRVYFVEASRTYDHSADERAMCAVAFGGGFFRREGNSVRSLDMDLRVVPCDRRGLVYMLPLGALRIGQELFWVVQFSSWDFEQYEIIEVERLRVKVAASTAGGRC